VRAYINLLYNSNTLALLGSSRKEEDNQKMRRTQAMKKAFGTMVAAIVVVLLIGVFITEAAAAEETSNDGRFIAYNDGTVLDTQTNLMWAKRDNGGNIDWANAKSYCENYRGGDYTDWRMPTVDELQGLYDANKSRPTACHGGSTKVNIATALIDITCSTLWTSEIRGSEGALFGFGLGLRIWIIRSYGINFRALPVRFAETKRIINENNDYGGKTVAATFSPGDKEYKAGMSKSIGYYNINGEVVKAESVHTNEYAQEKGILRSIMYLGNGKLVKTELFFTDESARRDSVSKSIIYYNSKGEMAKITCFDSRGKDVQCPED
jgi:hypothetical protein